MNRLFVVSLAMAWMTVDVSIGQAAWNNVFQTCCNKCRSRTSTSFFAPAPACEPKVTYVQRSFYTPYTTYKRETVWEPVTTYKTSYYWEPVTSYSYKSYYDPCTGACQNVATPRTSYKLRSKCDPVQSYVQRCQLVPVQSQRVTYYWEPVINNPCPTCETPNPNCPSCGPSGSPTITEGSGGARPQPGITEGSSGNIPPQNLPNGPASGMKRFGPLNPTPVRTPVRMDRTASFSSTAKVEGKIVHFDRFTPRTDSRLILVNQQKQKQIVSADTYGRFETDLPAGDWSIYIERANANPEFHSQIQIQPAQDRNVLVVSRD